MFIGSCIVAYFPNEKILSVQLPSGGVLRNIFIQKGVLVLIMVGSILHSVYTKLCPVSGTEITQRREETHQAGCWEPVAFVLALQVTFFLELNCHSQ